MASEELKVVITADASQATGEVNNFRNAMDETTDNVSSNSSGIADSLMAIGDAVLSAFSIKALTDFGTEITALANTQYESEVKMETVAKNRLKMNDDEIQGWKNLASAYQGVSTYGDEATLSVMALMGGILGSKEAVETLLPSVQDMTSYLYGADASAEQYSNTSKILARAIEDGSLTQLERQGIYLSDEYVAAWETAETAEERVIIMNDAIQDSYGSMSETMAETATGSLTQASNAWGDFKEQLGNELAPVLADVGEGLTDISNFLIENKSVIVPVITVIGSFVAILVSVKAAISAYNIVMGVMAVVNNASLAPIIAVVAAIAAVIAIIVLCVQHWDEIKEKVQEVWEKIVDAIKEAVDKVKQKIEDMKAAIKQKVEDIKASVSEKFNNIKTSMSDAVSNAKQAVVDKFNDIKTNITNTVNNIKSTVSSVFDNIKTAMTEKIQSAKDKVSEIIEKIKGLFDFSWSLPHLALPHVSISGKFSLFPPSVPTFSIDWYAKGGVFDAPTLFGYGGSIGGLGEAGAEAIVPLENNTEWLDKIAERLYNNNNQQIVLQVDGKTFAQTSIKSINELTRQTGRLGLVLA